MKSKELLKRLDEIQRKKSTLKKLYYDSINLLHEIEIGVQLLIEDVQKETKKK